MTRFDPIQSFVSRRHEFGEHGGVNMSVEASTTFTVIDPTKKPEIFQGHLGPDVGCCYLYGRHLCASARLPPGEGPVRLLLQEIPHWHQIRCS